MNSFIKVQAASILGSAADYLVTILLVEIFRCWYLPANTLGNICGGSLQFFLCRNWAFKAGHGRIRMQGAKFILFFLGNMILSAAGIYVFTQYLQINYISSKLITSILLGVTYNYFIQKKFVFT